MWICGSSVTDFSDRGFLPLCINIKHEKHEKQYTEKKVELWRHDVWLGMGCYTELHFQSHPFIFSYWYNAFERCGNTSPRKLSHLSPWRLTTAWTQAPWRHNLWEQVTQSLCFFSPWIPQWACIRDKFSRWINLFVSLLMHSLLSDVIFHHESN